MSGCYIIHSNKLEKYYVGATQENIEVRIKKHNSQEYGKHHFTAAATDCELFLFFPTDDYAQAIRIEWKIKSMKSSTYIKNLAKYPEIIDKLYSQTLRST